MSAYASITLVAVAVSLAVPATTPAGDAPPARFAVTTRKADDTVEVTGDRDRTVFGIRSRSGIGRAVIERTGDGWPKAVVVRLHLRGLENLRVSNGSAEVRAAVGVRDGTVEARQWKGDRTETPLEADDPLRLAVRVRDKDGKPAAGLPPDGGHVEVTLPAAFLTDNPKSLTVEWVDFYR